jgi:hypothetical protein
MGEFVVTSLFSLKAAIQFVNSDGLLGLTTIDKVSLTDAE